MLRVMARVGGVFLVAMLAAAPASAQVVQSLHFGGGAFLPRGEDGRVEQDVLFENLNSLEFEVSEFNSGHLFGEWLIGVSDHLEFGIGAGFYSGGTTSVYRSYTHPDDTEIEQDLKLRIAPITGLVRFLAGRPGTFQPYFGVGVSALRYRYSETGEFIDFTDFSTFRDRYIASGTAVGPAVMAGFRAPINGDIWGFTLEWRYQGVVGDTGGIENGFLDEKIDLGGNHVNFGFLVRF
jgi:hypothetical protein